MGAHLLFKLAKDKQSVRAIYRTEKKLNNVKQVFSGYTKDYEPFFNAIEWIKGDILDLPSLNDAFQNIDYVYHCAALVSFEPNKYQALRKTNIEGTANVVNLCIANHIKKLCYVSSVAALGSSTKNKPITEDSYWNPEEDKNVYAITKYGAEMEVWRATQEGLDAVIVNPSVILGAGFWEDGSGSLFKKASNGFNYYTKGIINLVDVEDVVSIMIQLLNSDIKNERFILVAENWPYKRFLKVLSQSVGAKPPRKLATPWLLDIVWRLDWLRHKLTGSKRQLTKHLSRSLSSETFYSNAKITSALKVEFNSIEETIFKVGLLYQKAE